MVVSATMTGGDVDKRTSLMIRLPKDLHRKLRHLAIDEGTTMTELVQKMCEDRLARGSKKGSAA